MTTLWAFVNLALIAYTVAWARSVQHRRRSHRFPAAVHVGYSAEKGELPSLAGRIEDLSRHGARLSVPDERAPGERLRLVLLLDDGPVELLGTVASVTPDAVGDGYIVGFDFDDLDAPVIDAIVAWCFRYPFGAEHSVGPRPLPRTAAGPSPPTRWRTGARCACWRPRSRRPRPSRPRSPRAARRPNPRSPRAELR